MAMNPESWKSYLKGVTSSYEAAVVCLSLAVSIQPFLVVSVDAPTVPLREADKVLHVLCPLVPHISEASHHGGHTGALGSWQCPVLAPDRWGVKVSSHA